MKVLDVCKIHARNGKREIHTTNEDETGDKREEIGNRDIKDTPFCTPHIQKKHRMNRVQDQSSRDREIERSRDQDSRDQTSKHFEHRKE